MFLGLSAVAKNLVVLILTEKWLPSVPMMQIICVTYAFTTMNSSNMQVFNSMGRSDLFMKFELIKRSISIVLLVAASFVSVYAAIVVLLLMAVLSNMMNAYQNKKLLGIKFREQAKYILSPFVCAAIMWVLVMAVGLIKMNVFVSLIVQILTGVIVYLALSYIFRLQPLFYLVNYIKNLKKS